MAMQGDSGERAERGPDPLPGSPFPESVQRALDCMVEGLQLIDFDYRYRYLNPAAARHGRRPRHELLGRTMMACYPGIEETPMFARLRECMSERRFVQMENEFRYPDGSTGWFELHFEPAPEGVLVLSLDITERKQLEAQLRQSQKMEAVGRLAGGVAHDFNNLLSVILSCATFLEPAVAGKEPASEDVAAIIAAARRAAEITGQLLSFSRSQVMTLRAVTGNELAQRIEPLLRRAAGTEVDLFISLSPEPWRVQIDVGQMEQVLLNLVINACDAMPDGGKLTVEISNVEADATYAGGHARMEPGPYVMIAVSDTGHGMTREVRERVFEPFFTTKEDGRGSGLGLATCYGIVKQVGGDISVYSELGRGTTFKVYLPRHLGAADAQRPAPPPRTSGGEETILVIEDDVAVRAVMVRALRERGYAVLSAGDAADAAAIAAGNGGIDLLITDMVLPGGSGAEIAGDLAREGLVSRTLYISGYPDAAVVRHGVVDPGASFLQKPFAPETLATRVRALLDAG
jgi:two-component system, cell cycle sensor histidine kinase and response regulator CckA